MRLSLLHLQCRRYVHVVFLWRLIRNGERGGGSIISERDASQSVSQSQLFCRMCRYSDLGRPARRSCSARMHPSNPTLASGWCKYYSLGDQVVKRFCNTFSDMFPFLAWAVCSIGPTACGTFMKHSTNPCSQPDAPDWTSPFALIGCYAWGRRSSLEVEVVKVRQTRWLRMRRDKRDLNLISDACRSLGRTHLSRKYVQGFTDGFLFCVHWGLAVRIHHYVSIHLT